MTELDLTRTLRALTDSVGDESTPKDKALFILASALEDVIDDESDPYLKWVARSALARASAVLDED